jgi:hypothetical protein
MSRKNNPVTVSPVTVSPITTVASTVEVTVLCVLSMIDRAFTYVPEGVNLAITIGEKVLPASILYLHRYVVETVLPSLSMEVGKVYGIRRAEYLNLLCQLWGISPRPSTKSNGGVNAGLKTYGFAPSGRGTFASDGVAYSTLSLTGPDPTHVFAFDSGSLKFRYIKKHLIMVFAHTETFNHINSNPFPESSIYGVNLPAIDAGLVSRFRSRVRAGEIDRLTAEIFEDSAFDLLTK